MDNFGLVTICSQVYNTKPYLAQCINSVLSQTYSNFEYILLDNGCSDGSSEVLEDFANKDSRIRLIRYEENQQVVWHRIIKKFASGDYLTFIDSDDWWDSDFLEHLLVFLNHHDLDLAITGTMAFFEASQTHGVMRRLERPVSLTPTQLARQYPVYWVFPSTVWGSILKMEVYRSTDLSPLFYGVYTYGLDTVIMIHCIKNCANVGIDDSALYHYRIRPKSITYQYDPHRFDSDVFVYRQIKDFLVLHDTFDGPKQEWLKQVYLASMLATVKLIKDADMPDEEKVKESARIATHPLTTIALTRDCNERSEWCDLMWDIMFCALSSRTLSDGKSLSMTLRVLSPHCYSAVQIENLGLFVREASLWEMLREDDRDGLTARLLDMIAQKRYTKQYDLGRALCSLVPDSSPLRGISDTHFFQKYAPICMYILEQDYSNALDQMTGLLLGKKKLYDSERFLDVYLSLAALENYAPAFMFGKVQLAWLYLRHNRREECHAAVAELIEMGLETEELAALRQELERHP